MFTRPKTVKKPLQPKVHLQVAHTEDPSRSDYHSDISGYYGNQSELTEAVPGDDHDKEPIKIEVPDDLYSNECQQGLLGIHVCGSQ